MFLNVDYICDSWFIDLFFPQIISVAFTINFNTFMSEYYRLYQWYNQQNTTVNFKKKTHNRHPVPFPWGLTTGYFLWVQNLCDQAFNFVIAVACMQIQFYYIYRTPGMSTITMVWLEKNGWNFYFKILYMKSPHRPQKSVCIPTCVCKLTINQCPIYIILPQNITELHTLKQRSF